MRMWKFFIENTITIDINDEVNVFLKTLLAQFHEMLNNI